MIADLSDCKYSVTDRCMMLCETRSFVRQEDWQFVPLCTDIHGINTLRQTAVISVFHANRILNSYQKTVS